MYALPADRLNYTIRTALCDGGWVRSGCMHHGTDYLCSGSAHYQGQHIVCTSSAHIVVGYPDVL